MLQLLSVKAAPDALFFGHVLMLVSRAWRSVVDGRLA